MKGTRNICKRLSQFISLIAATLLLGHIGAAQETAKAGAIVRTPKIFSMPIDNVQPPSDNAQQPSVSDPKAASQSAPSVCGTRYSAGSKLKYGLEQAFLNPQTYIFPAVTAMRQQRDVETPNKSFGDDFADGLSRYAINFGTASSKALLTSGVYPTIFKQNPHYEHSHKSGFGARAAYAASRVFVTCGDNGNQQFNISRIGGDLTASALANLWERNQSGHDRIGVGPTFKRFGFMVGFDVLSSIVIKEFGSDIKRMLRLR